MDAMNANTRLGKAVRAAVNELDSLNELVSVKRGAAAESGRGGQLALPPMLHAPLPRGPTRSRAPETLATAIPAPHTRLG